ncbi:MAG: hypothetical protein CBD58_02220 [bacterium TMED198]|nr:MAG: hypothetical protein CBD58_02220 [bacterium TMED198]
MNKVLEFKNIAKKYSNVEALKNISFSIPENSIFGILGANGSGKSTFMKILPGLIQSFSGSIFFKKQLIKKNDVLLREKFGYLIESPTFYEYLSARKNLELLARVSYVDFDRIDYVLNMVELSNRSYDKVNTYSYGMKQRLGIAQALLHDPEIIVLDEPNNGLDPNGIDDMIRLIKNLKINGKTICLSTHNLKDVEDICTHFTVFKDGLNSVSSSMDEQLLKSRRWFLNVDDTDNAVLKIKESTLFDLVSVFNKNILVDSKAKDSISALKNLLEGHDIYKLNKDSNLIEYFKND